MARILTTGIGNERDVVAARQRAREIAGLLGLSAQDQSRVATAVSEVARYLHTDGDGGRLEFCVDSDAQPFHLLIRVVEHAASAPDAGLAGALFGHAGKDRAELANVRRLVDRCEVENATGAVVLRKRLPSGVDPGGLGGLNRALSAAPLGEPLAELHAQNRELAQALNELKSRQDELLSLTRELEDTNRGVVALYAEIEEKANHLRRADEMKSRFLSNTSHELRTPLSSIRALAKLLLDRIDGDLTEEQEKQVGLILKAADDLYDLVNDLLDLAKIEAGKVEVRPTAFSVADLFSTLRGMLRPLSSEDSVRLVFQPGEAPGGLFNDDGKVSQILRNFISNALKFTQAGEVRVSAHPETGDRVRFTVADTGIGIAAEHLHLIFEEFSQIENPLQRRAKGTGLGLPLCQKLARLLGGSIEVESEPGRGSSFSLILPQRYRDPEPDPNPGSRADAPIDAADSASVPGYDWK